MTADMEVYVNGDPALVPERSTIALLIERFEEAEKHIIVERNGCCVYPQEYATTVVAPGDRIEFIHPAFGG
ncbi:MAG: sulfur carrier protein ThiS [Deltaproteobacteria bacterium]|nr:sulfur carrier protein ThiS [Deltaproteobacteria bacterium]